MACEGHDLDTIAQALGRPVHDVRRKLDPEPAARREDTPASDIHISKGNESHMSKSRPAGGAVIGKLPAELATSPCDDRVAWPRMMATAFDVVYGPCGIRVAAASGWPADQRDRALDLYRAIRDDGPAAVMQTPLPDHDRATVARRRTDANRSNAVLAAVPFD
jgi:hypothetical protein